MNTTAQDDAGWTGTQDDGWVAYYGFSCPVDLDCQVDVINRDNIKWVGRAGAFNWKQVLHYRLRKPATPSDPADAEIVGMLRKACKELTGKNATFADDDLRAIVALAATPSPDLRALLDMAVEALDLAANRIHRMSIDYSTGTLQFIEAGEWADEARSTLATIKQKMEGL